MNTVGVLYFHEYGHGILLMYTPIKLIYYCKYPYAHTHIYIYTNIMQTRTLHLHEETARTNEEASVLRARGLVGINI